MIAHSLFSLDMPQKTNSLALVQVSVAGGELPPGKRGNCLENPDHLNIFNYYLRKDFLHGTRTEDCVTD
ncbi:hypothetical protein U27_04736 [Candidatus Vecturithrix granuli]|uniref:Uncharacterized protein n=1 Tax=Vecturithrix granuli TaxID=1499967 RepID=A0A081BZL4_VECG1|nr:hypothetical protein U27_04736 [Candidatus Vecturithrix granuli]